MVHELFEHMFRLLWFYEGVSESQYIARYSGIIGEKGRGQYMKGISGVLS